MNKSTFKRKGDLFPTDLYKKCTTNNKKLSFESLCKENFRQHLDDLNFGKFVVNNLIVDKL